MTGSSGLPFVCKHRSSVGVPETGDNQLPNCNIGYSSADSNTSCYGFDSLVQVYWNYCDSYCIQIGGRCASIYNRQQNSDIYALFQTTQPPSDMTDITNGFHIGLKENGTTWYWVDGTPYDNSFWAPGYPRSGQTPYVSAATNGLWATDSRDVFRSTACRHDPITQLSNNICPTAEYFGMGEIRSPGFPENYAFNQTCTYTLYDPIDSSWPTKLAIYFITFITHPLDVVEIFDGPNVNSPLIANVSGIAGAKQEYYSTGK